MVPRRSEAPCGDLGCLWVGLNLEYVGERYVEDSHGDVDREGEVRGYIDAIEVPTLAGSSSVVLRRAASIRVRRRRAGWPSRREHL